MERRFNACAGPDCPQQRPQGRPDVSALVGQYRVVLENRTPGDDAQGLKLGIEAGVPFACLHLRPFAGDQGIILPPLGGPAPQSFARST